MDAFHGPSAVPLNGGHEISQYSSSVCGAAWSTAYPDCPLEPERGAKHHGDGCSEDLSDSQHSTSGDDSLERSFSGDTPPESPAHRDSPGAGAIPQSRHCRGMLGAALPRPARKAARVQKRPPYERPLHDRNGHYRAASIENPQRHMMDHKTTIRPFVQSHDRPKKQSACSGDVDRLMNSLPIHEQYHHDTVQRSKGLIQLPAHGKYPGLILQPDSSPISQDQLAAEVKSIYAGLVMVEAKCINIDAAQSADPKQQLGREQWQALIALHRTLLYEHHDFLMATQHPSATPALRGLATKYNMPARMWKHAIHAFLEVLRHRRPESQDYMLAFIYLAYQMMALLFETVPSFTDTWIECLGDLARYRMAIEEEKEAHATWGGVAARWYTLASDRHPAIGRLYHHLGILERPSLRKFCLYAKSLTCVIPFTNARDSLSTLCGPIVRDELTVRSGTHLVEARIVTFHALICSRSDVKIVEAVRRDASDLLHRQFSKIKDFGAYLAVTNIAALFEFGSPTNMLFQQYTTAINQAMQQSRPSMAVPGHPMQFAPVLTQAGPNPLLESSETFWADCFNLIVENYDLESMKDTLPFIHITLVMIHSLHSLRTRLSNGQNFDTYKASVSTGRLAWGAFAGFLNTLAQQERISGRVLACAQQGVFLAPEHKEDARPLSEDYQIRGLIWGQFYFSPGWFDGQSEDDGRTIETPAMQTARAQRVLWLGVYLAMHTEFLQFDEQRQVFSAWSAYVPATKSIAATKGLGNMDDVADCYTMEQASILPAPGSRSSHAPSSSSNSEDGFTIVKPPRTKDPPPQSRSWARVAAKPTKSNPMRKQKPKQDLDTFQVADEDDMVWTAEGEGRGSRSAHPGGIRSRYSE